MSNTSFFLIYNLINILCSNFDENEEPATYLQKIENFKKSF